MKQEVFHNLSGIILEDKDNFHLEENKNGFQIVKAEKNIYPIIKKIDILNKLKEQGNKALNAIMFATAGKGVEGITKSKGLSLGSSLLVSTSMNEVDIFKEMLAKAQEDFSTNTNEVRTTSQIDLALDFLIDNSLIDFISTSKNLKALETSSKNITDILLKIEENIKLNDTNLKNSLKENNMDNAEKEVIVNLNKTEQDTEYMLMLGTDGVKFTDTPSLDNIIERLKNVKSEEILHADIGKVIENVSFKEKIKNYGRKFLATSLIGGAYSVGVSAFTVGATVAGATTIMPVLTTLFLTFVTLGLVGKGGELLLNSLQKDKNLKGLKELLSNISNLSEKEQSDMINKFIQENNLTEQYNKTLKQEIGKQQRHSMNI